MASDRMMLKVSQIARLRIMGTKDTVIAKALSLSASGFQRIIRTQFYRDYEQAVLNGHISKLDEKLAANRNLLRRQATNMLPEALRGLGELARQRKDLKTALEAQRDILRIDPDKTFTVDSAKTVTVHGGTTALPAAFFEAIAKDADGVSVSIATAIAKQQKEN